jgi:hypothetical protein
MIRCIKRWDQLLTIIIWLRTLYSERNCIGLGHRVGIYTLRLGLLDLFRIIPTQSFCILLGSVYDYISDSYMDSGNQ